MANRAGEVNPDLDVDETQSLVPDKDHQPPTIKDKYERSVAEFDGDHALVSKGLAGCPTGNDAYTVEVLLTHPTGGSVLGGWQVAFFLGKPNCNGQNLGMGVNGQSKGMSNFWWANDCAKEHVDDDTWTHTDEAHANEEGSWLRLAVCWDPSKKQRKIFMNGKMLNEDNAQGSEHRKFGPEEGAVIALGDCGRRQSIRQGAGSEGMHRRGSHVEGRARASLLFKEIGGSKISALTALVMNPSEASQALADYLSKAPAHVPAVIVAACTPGAAPRRSGCSRRTQASSSMPCRSSRS